MNTPDSSDDLPVFDNSPVISPTRQHKNGNITPTTRGKHLISTTWQKLTPTSKHKSLSLPNRGKKLDKTAARRNHSDVLQKPLPWAELEENGAVYNTTLKKVRYRSLHFTDLDDPNTAFKQWETVKIKHLKAGNLKTLVEHLTPIEDDTFDSGFLLAFLCTYQSFADADEVVELLLKRFELCENQSDTNDAVLRRICNVFCVWLDQYVWDFDMPTLKQIQTFIEHRKHLICIAELRQRLENPLTTLQNEHNEQPYKFKFCNCPNIVGCSCESKTVGDSFKQFSPEECAQQLTLVDSELFLRVVPRESLSYYWSKRDESKGSRAPSIKLTVDHFNALSQCVIATILNATDEKSQQPSSLARSKLICKWLDIAMELRRLKNFSSLKAILSGLQTCSIYRLSLSWQLVPKSSSVLYSDLSDIFSDEMNSKAFRDLILQEGTSKYSTESLEKSKRHTLEMKEGITHGTVPYLGTFLTDLTMIDTALPDTIKDGLINFEKRRKEFEVVVLIKLLQEASKNYSIKPNSQFFAWFNSVQHLTDEDSYALSLEREPKDLNKNTPSPVMPKRTLRRYLSTNDLFDRQSTSEEKEYDLLSLYSLKLSKSSFDLRSSSNIVPEAAIARTHFKAESIFSNNTLLHPDRCTPLDQEGVIGRIYLEDAVGVLYKSVKITPTSRACDVITATLEKFKVEEQADRYSLYQIIDDKKSLHIPLNSNMYYAMNKSSVLCFKVCLKQLKKSRRKNRHSQVMFSDMESFISLKTFSPL